MTIQALRNIQAFMKRVPVTGEESIAWCQAWAELEAEMEALSASVSKLTVRGESA